MSLLHRGKQCVFVLKLREHAGGVYQYTTNDVGMSERAETPRTAAPRATTEREWELFVRDDRADPLRHAGSVTAPTANLAREQATRLLGWDATDIWLCPADETERVTVEER
jgi:rSAM-partnered protein